MRITIEPGTYGTCYNHWNTRSRRQRWREILLSRSSKDLPNNTCRLCVLGQRLGLGRAVEVLASKALRESIVNYAAQIKQSFRHWRTGSSDLLNTSPWLKSKRILVPLAIILALALMSVLFVNECSFTAGMGSAYKTCDCAGYEWLQYDRTPADGPRRTICLGIVRSVDCFRSVGEPEVACD